MYRRPLSAADIAPAFPVDASVEEALQNVIVVYVEDGSKLSLHKHSKKSKFFINASDCSCDSTYASVCDAITQDADRVYGFQLTGSLLSVQRMNDLLTMLLEFGRFKYLVHLDLSYVDLSHVAINSLCSLLDPAHSGYSPIKRLLLSHCHLGCKAMQKLFNALRANVFLFELFLAGNHATDACCEALSGFLANPDNRLSVLCLNDNDLTPVGIAEIQTALACHPRMCNLQLNSNSLLDPCLDRLLQALVKTETLHTLSVSHCSLVSCIWAKHLSDLEILTDLNVSNNDIDDFGCLALCKGLEKCGSLRHLNASKNIFGSDMCAGLGSLLLCNQGLHTLNLSYMPMTMTVWAALAEGLKLNKSLLELDVRWCVLDIEKAACLCQALEDNNICTVNMDFNPLPDILMADCRQHCPEVRRQVIMSPPIRHPLGEAAGNALAPLPVTVHPLPLHADCQLLAMDVASAWRAELYSAMLIDTALRGFDAEGNEIQLQSKRGDADVDAHIVRGMKDKDITIAYGNVSEVMGTIRVQGSTTYFQAKALITPLIRAYLASVDPLSMQDLLHDFTFLDSRGRPMVGSILQVNNHCVVPRELS